MDIRKDTGEILAVLESTYSGIGPALVFRSPFELLVAVILSAQTNDNQVNKITAPLFQRFRGPADFALLDPLELEGWIKTCGLYKMKAKNIVNASQMILRQYGGEVPKTREELMTLPGVGRKTANVVLSNAFGIPALGVDTHVFRVAHRLGLSDGKTADETENHLTAVIHRKKWGEAHHWLIWHGRKVCTAKKPACSSCPVREYCPSFIGEEN